MFEAYFQAIERERSLRDLAFRSPVRTICGIEVRVMTLGDLLHFQHVASPLICGGPLEVGDVMKFLERLSTQLESKRGIRRSFVRFGINATVAYVGLEAVLREIAAYLEEIFMDAPPSQPGKRGPAPVVSASVTWCEWAAAEYGWIIPATLSTPLPCLYQMERQCQRRKDPKAILFNKFSDRAKSEYGRKKNAKNND